MFTWKFTLNASPSLPFAHLPMLAIKQTLHSHCIHKCFCGKNTVEQTLIDGGKGREKGREKAEFIAYNFSVDFYIMLSAIQRSQDCPD